MKVLAFLFILAFISVAIYAFICIIRFAYVHIKAFIIRHKLSKLAETEKKDD